MVDFAGWEMPVQYGGILAEHHAVRSRAGLFDVSHMGEIEVRGAKALAACQKVTSNDVSRLRDGQAQYSLLLLPTGGIVDDIVVHRLAQDRFLLCVNASNRDGDFEWIRENVRDADVVDRGDEYAQLALQGPVATATLASLTSVPLGQIPRFSFVEGSVADRRCVVAHTGYTGEDGWELYCAPGDAATLWEAILGFREGEVVPAGLGARDTLRLEAALPLYGHELSVETSPFAARLGWVVKLDKGDFIGREALLRQKSERVTRRLIGLQLSQSGVPRADYRILREGRPIGSVTSGTMSPTLGKGIALGYVDATGGERGAVLAVEIRGRAVPAEVVSLPFYRCQK
jgi:aminomethyltransferase